MATKPKKKKTGTKAKPGDKRLGSKFSVGNKFALGNNGGRPTKHTPETIETICLRLSNGESLNRICRDKTLPSKTTVLRWLLDPDKKQFRVQYTQARESQSETFIDECVDIADDTEDDTITLINKDGDEYKKVNHDHINRSRLRIDTRIKIAEKMAPKKYTPRKALEHTGEGGRDLFPSLSPEEQKKLQEIFKKQQ